MDSQEASTVVRGTGTALNVATVLVGSGIGVLLGDRLQQRVRDVITDGLGLVVLLIAALNAVAVRDAAFRAAVGNSSTVIVVLAAVVLGGWQARCSVSRRGWSCSAAGCNDG